MAEQARRDEQEQWRRPGPCPPRGRPTSGAAHARLHAHRGNDPSIGLWLGELLRQAGLEQVQRGWFSLASPPPGVRPPLWAAREALVAEGVATSDDLSRWAAALERQDQAVERPTLFLPMFSAVGRRPG